MDYEQLMERIERLEYHQSLLLKMASNSPYKFYQLVIEKSLSEKDVAQFYKLCEDLSMELDKQKADEFVYFHPLFEEFKSKLHPSLCSEAVIPACLSQKIFLPLMMEFKNYV